MSRHTDTHWNPKWSVKTFSRECAATNLGYSQLAVWHGANLWQLHCQNHAARASGCISLHLELVLWLLRLRVCGGDDLDQILTFVLGGAAHYWSCHVLISLLRLQRRDLLQQGSGGLADCKNEQHVLMGTVAKGEREYVGSGKGKPQQHEVLLTAYHGTRLCCSTWVWLFGGVGPLLIAEPLVQLTLATFWAAAHNIVFLRQPQTILLPGKVQGQHADFFVTLLIFL